MTVTSLSENEGKGKKWWVMAESGDSSYISSLTLSIGGSEKILSLKEEVHLCR